MLLLMAMGKLTSMLLPEGTNELCWNDRFKKNWNTNHEITWVPLDRC